MKKKLLLVPVISLGLFSGITGGVSAAETENHSQNQTHSTIINTSSSIHDKAYELKFGSQKSFTTTRSNPIKYYKFYYEGYLGYDGVYVKFGSNGSHKMTILNGKFIEIGSGFPAIADQDLTNGWNYIEVVDTKPRLGGSNFDLEIILF
ncbi:hypothetical protein [Bacillus safensis]|uniref:hypothetical protein n=1 Tax=Bacillus safensis TaxID=561879 RepID=UPI001CD666A5|nr:hypothetical protein [Bacillus safensis]